MRVRPDLVGVVYAYAPDGVVVLRAGDEVPEGVSVSPDLVVEVASAKKPSTRRRKATS